MQKTLEKLGFFKSFQETKKRMADKHKAHKAKVYIDGSNVFYTQKKLGWSLDWAKVKSFLEKEREALEYRYYVGLRDNDDKMHKFLKYLNRIGFKVITKPLKKIKVKDFGLYPQARPTGYIFKSNFDVEITADILLDRAGLDELVIFSGDSDFEYLLKKVRDLGLKTLVMASKRTLSWELKLAASDVWYLESLRESFARQN